MAWAVSLEDYGQEHPNSTAYVSGSFTPTADSLLIAVICHTDDATVSGISGHDGGGSWVQVFSWESVGDTDDDVEVWACFTGSSPSAGTVTISKTGYMWHCYVHIIEIDENVDGVDMSGTVANAFGVNGVDTGGYNASPHSISLGSFDDSDNLTFACGISPDFENANFTFEGGYTGLTGANSIRGGYIGSEDTTVTVTQSSWEDGGAFAFEVKMAAAAGTTMSVSENINISESITIDGLIQDLAVDLFEQLNLSEYVLPSMNLGAISVDETFELAESLVSGVPLGFSKYEQITLIEFLQLLEIIAPSAFEQITITEYLNLLKDIGVNEFENITVNELISATLGGGIDQSESIELSEFVSMLKDIGIDTSQQITITEVIYGVVSLIGIAGEDITITEAVTGILSITGIDTSQSINVSEFINVLSTSDIPITDAYESITITEALTLLFSHIPASEIQNINVSEFINLLLTTTGINVSESIALSEYTLLLTSLATISVSDSVTLSEAVTALLETTGANVYELISINEYIQGILEITGISVSDSVTISEFVYVTMVTVAGIMKINFSVRRPGVTYLTRKPKITFN